MRQYLHTGSRCGSAGGADCSTFTAASDCTDDCAKNSAATEIFAGTSIGSDAGIILRTDEVFTMNAITLAIDHHGIKVEDYVIPGYSPHDELDVGTTRDCDISVM